MQAIVECGGFQYKVAPGDVIEVPRMKAGEGSEVTLDRVLATMEGGKSVFGTPTVAGVAVKASVVAHGLGPKILVMKRKRRKDYRRKNGHRQQFTRLQITAIGS